MVDTHCSSYPYSLSIYRSDRTILTLDLLGPTIAFSSLFGSSLKQILIACEKDVDAAMARAKECLDSLPDAGTLKQALRDVYVLLNDQASLRWLIEQPKTLWPAGLSEGLDALYATGFYINCQMVPDSAKGAMTHYFADSGDGFLSKLGSLTLKDYFVRRRNTYTDAELALLAKGRRLGVLMCHETIAAASLDSGKRRCWNGFNCVQTPENRQCNGDTGSSDIC